MKTPSIITEAKLLEEMERMNHLLERLCIAVERITPPAPDTSVTIDFVDEVPDIESEDKDESAGLDEQEINYEMEIMSMTEPEYAQFVRDSGSDPRPRIREKLKIARNTVREGE